MNPQPEPAPDIYDPSATLRHYSKMARDFQAVSEQAHEGTFTASSMEGVHACEALYEVSEQFMDMAFGLSEGEDLRALVARLLRQPGGKINREGVKMAAPDLLEPDMAPPRLVLTKSKAADNYMECAAYRRFLRLVDIYDASLMATVEKYPPERQLHAKIYYEPRKDALDGVRRKLIRDIEWLERRDLHTRPLTPQDYEPL